MAAVEVRNLNYTTPIRVVDVLDAKIEQLRPKLPKALGEWLVKINPVNLSIKLYSISFTAKPRELTAILSSEHGELRTISQLLGGRANFGTFDGHIYMDKNGTDATNDSSVGFVSRVAKDLYIPGLTYYDMLHYAARLRLAGPGGFGLPSTAITARVKEVLEYMDLEWCQQRVIPDRPSTRGEIGGELRRLVIAVEIISLPKVVVLDDPARGLDSAVADHLFRRLKFLADSGYTVIAAVPRASPATYKLFNKTVLISGGYSIYSGPSDSIKDYFTSPHLSYVFKESRNPCEFLLDISSGIERPRGQREAPTSLMLQQLFESSPFYDESNGMNTTIQSMDSPLPFSKDASGSELGASVTKVDLLPEDSVPLYGFQFSGVLNMVYKSTVVLERSFVIKSHEREVLKKSLAVNVFLSLFIGYFMWETGDFGDYCTSLFGFPYADTSNSAALCFLSAAVIMVQQVLNVHIICQKIRVFRYEQKSGAAPHFGFWISTLVSESVFAIFFSLIFGSVLYLMSKLNDLENMPFFLGVMMMNTLVGVFTTVMFAAVFKAEIIVRDLFLVCTFLMLFTAGFIFTLPTIRSSVRDASVVNPLRWIFEALMVWKFTDVEDGRVFLESYGFESFEQHKIWGILSNFLFFSGAIFFIVLIPSAKTLRREKVLHSSTTDRLSTASGDSTDESTGKGFRTPSNTPRKNSKRNTPAAPLLFLRESSISGKKSTITSQHSSAGVGGEVDATGPTLIFSNITYRVKDRKSPLGYKDLLHSVSGQFDWGKLSVVMGAMNSGKSTLLQVLGGIPMSSTTRVSGRVVLDNKPYDKTLQTWQLCAYVGHSDEHYRDLSVMDIITYAMKLRCVDVAALKDIEVNVKNAMDLLQLTEFANVKSKRLTPGAMKRLSIAEEIVHGPPLLLIDEPLTGLDPKDIAILMNVFREMVNQDRTVVATAHSLTSDVFHLFDTLLLLSKGRVAYMGATNMAVTYFSESLRMQFDVSQYFNPADLLLDISGCHIKNVDNEAVDAPTLELYFMSSSLYRDYSSQFGVGGDKEGQDEDIDYTSATAGQQSSKLNTIMEGALSTRDVRHLSNASSTATPTSSKGFSQTSSTNPLRTHLMPSSSFDMSSAESETDLMADTSVSFMDTLHANIKSIRETDYRIVRLHSEVILSRSIFALFKRYKLVIGSLILHIFFALIFWWVMDDSSEDTNPVVGFFAVSGLVLIVANVQFGYYLFSNNEVFLKEHSRGLYSCFIYWMWSPLPFLILRGALGMMYGIIVVDLLGISKDEDERSFFLLLTVLFIFASATIGEALICLSPDLRTVYSLIPGFSLILFFFSGLMVKPSTIPSWTQSWLPSISVVRWMAQALTINEFKDNTELFPVLFGFDSYQALLSLFGWGGKTKWYCLYIVALNVGIFRIVAYIALLIRSHSQIGNRGQITNVNNEDKLY